MEQIKIKKRLTEMTKEEKEREFQRMKEEELRRIAELDAPELTKEEKEILIGIKMALEEETSEGYTIEETMEILFGKEGLCT